MVIVLTTVPTRAVGRKLSKELLKLQLAACVSLSAAIESFYVWKGKQENSREILCWIKTTSGKKKQVMNFLKREHPYEVPEIVALKPTDVDTSYLKWVQSSVKNS
jgi:uncharacterized protein involved in tolerance to divalent cations